MRKIKEILRLHFESRCSMRQISAVVGTSTGAVHKLITRAHEHKLSWPLPEGWDETKLEQALYPRAQSSDTHRYALPDWREIHQELKRKGMTKQLLWEACCLTNSERSYSRSQFCDLYGQWLKRQKRSLRQLHKAGEKAFIDYAGLTIPVVDSRTGKVAFEAQMFIAVLGASNYTYAEASRSQSLPDWLQSHVRMFEFFGGAVEMLIPDNLKSGVRRLVAMNRKPIQPINS